MGVDWSKKRTSNNFIITFVATENKKSLEKIVKKTFTKMTKHELKHHDGVLHAYKELAKTKYRVIDLVARNSGVSIMYIYLNKKKAYTKLQNEKHILYNYVTNILLDRVVTKRLVSSKNEIELVVEQRETNRILNDNFSGYINNQLEQKLLNISVNISKPHQQKGLQIADVISWSIFRAHEYNDRSYIEKLESKIIEDRALFP